jgi:hypothetical protein
MSLDQVAGAKRIFNCAIGRKTCFVVMPFDAKLRKVYEIVSSTLAANGWTVARADEISHPRRVTDTILQAILVSDLVVADLTGNNR